MKRLIKIWHLLGISIFEGERRERNLRTIAIIALTLQIPSLIGFICYINTPMRTFAVCCLLYFLTNLVNFYLAAIKKNREAVFKLGIVLAYIASTNISIFAKNGFAGNWTLLFPLIICYLFSVRSGIVFSSYMTILHMILYWTPLRYYFTWYTPVYLNRFPFIYLTITLNTAYIMSEYHLNILERQEYEKKLEAARDEAQAANKAKSDFLASMSHEIRTPLNAVLGMNTMIFRECHQAENLISKSSESYEFFEKIISYSGNIDSAGNNLLSIINEILDFSKIEAGKIELAHENYKLSSILNDINNMILLRAEAKGLDFQIEVDEAMPDFYCGDEMRVRLIIQNLLTNAVKYTDRGSVKFSIKRADCDAQINPGGMLALKISVQDTGIGIKHGDLDKLFKRFERVNLKHNSTIEGTGLGLAITKRICDMMNGDIKVESEYGEGSTFTAVIYQKVVSCEPVGNFREKFETSLKNKKDYHESFVSLARGTRLDAQILIVDDTKFNLIVAVGLLKHTGVKIDTASGGFEAVILAKNRHYDLILMDQRMPGMDGTEALKRIREFDKNTPVICLTADAVSGAKARYLAQGFTDYLSKPLDGFELEKMLLKYIPENKIIKNKNVPDIPNSINFEAGLRYSQGDENLYGTLLKEFVLGSGEKIKSLKKFYDAHDYENYGIAVHALKSSSKTIGASRLPDVCAELENAANNNNAALIYEKHALMLELYENIIEKIKNSRPDLMTGSENSDDNENEILEFLPDSGD